MTRSPSTPEGAIRARWESLNARPGGKRLFSFLLGLMVPYTGTVRPRVEELRPGYARVSMRDRRRVRNHLNSVHAIALMNLAEVATGLALNFDLPPAARSILKGISIEFHKKARGTLVAEATAPVLAGSEERELEVETAIRDAAGDVVATARARWLIGPRR
ncbi:MAG TPA: hotdog fold domain-containing protein [Longimicrobiaceae bacterium]|nr:hotdog fold domain-containing protein [Longimicrobiaceae bacterium]